MILIDEARFQIAHGKFLEHMQAHARNKEPFTSFKHTFLVEDEVYYKQRASELGPAALQLDKWSRWRAETGKILQATKDACQSKVNLNLLEHRRGPEHGSYQALYLVKTRDKIKGLENVLFDFFLGGDQNPDNFGPRFDRFAKYLKANGLGYRWDFVAYLAFLSNPQRYFPIRSKSFDRLLKFYEVGRTIEGKVTWENYCLLLDLAEELRERLLCYGAADAIEIQSYMWVVSSLIKEGKISERDSLPKFDSGKELDKRIKRATKRERIGLQGEEFILDEEVKKLKQAGRNDLAARVQIVAAEESTSHFDILSYTPEAQEIHIEVKTTTRSPANDDGFWLSDNERQMAKRDSRWTIYRVWSIDTATPSYNNIGNIVQEAGEEWELSPTTWYARLKGAQQ